MKGVHNEYRGADNAKECGCNCLFHLIQHKCGCGKCPDDKLKQGPICIVGHQLDNSHEFMLVSEHCFCELHTQRHVKYADREEEKEEAL